MLETIGMSLATWLLRATGNLRAAALLPGISREPPAWVWPTHTGVEFSFLPVRHVGDDEIAAQAERWMRHGKRAKGVLPLQAPPIT